MLTEQGAACYCEVITCQQLPVESWRFAAVGCCAVPHFAAVGCRIHVLPSQMQSLKY